MNKITSSGISAFITALLILGGVKLTEDNVYVCEDRQIAMLCEELTSYYGLPNGKCVNSKLGNKLCRSGWTDKYQDWNEENSTEIVNVNANGKEWKCEVRNGQINSYTYCTSKENEGYLGELI